MDIYDLHPLLGCTYVLCVLGYASLGLRSILYPIALTIVHLDSTPILPLHSTYIQYMRALGDERKEPHNMRVNETVNETMIEYETVHAHA
jgi:hypothetical protein